MRQGIVIFAAAAPAPASPAAEVLVATVQAALGTDGVAGTYLAYGDPGASQPLRKLVGGPPPRFFPQAARPTLGERMAQAFAFLFVQDFERVLLVQPGAEAPTPTAMRAVLAGLDDAPVQIETGAGATLVALRRADFPHVAAIFETIAWERPGAKEAAERLLAEASHP